VTTNKRKSLLCRIHIRHINHQTKAAPGIQGRIWNYNLLLSSCLIERFCYLNRWINTSNHQHLPANQTWPLTEPANHNEDLFIAQENSVWLLFLCNNLCEFCTEGFSLSFCPSADNMAKNCTLNIINQVKYYHISKVPKYSYFCNDIFCRL